MSYPPGTNDGSGLPPGEDPSRPQSTPPPVAPGYRPYPGQARGPVPPSYGVGYPQQPQPGHYGAYRSPASGPYTTASADANSGMAVASLILGIVSWFTVWFFGLGFVAAILGVIFGHIGMAQHRGGRGLALAGLIISYGAIVFVVLFFIVIFGVFPNRPTD